MMDAPGNIDIGTTTLVEGDDEAKRWLRGADRRVDDWLYELIDGIVFFAAERLRMRAPGSIAGLVDVLPAHETMTGRFEGIAGVEPDITEENFLRGLGSDPADYPVFVEVGTGIFGPVGEPISSIPGHLMVFQTNDGAWHAVQRVKGQRPQHYAERAFEDTTAIVPQHIQAALPELGRRE